VAKCYLWVKEEVLAMSQSVKLGDDLMALIRQAILQANRGMVYDNSRLNAPPRPYLVFDRGRLVSAAPVLPAWIRNTYASELVL
jgi:hypothetical protein